MSTTSQSTCLSVVHGCWCTERFKTTGDSMYLQTTCITFVFAWRLALRVVIETVSVQTFSLTFGEVEKHNIIALQKKEISYTGKYRITIVYSRSRPFWNVYNDWPPVTRIFFWEGGGGGGRGRLKSRLGSFMGVHQFIAHDLNLQIFVEVLIPEQINTLWTAT